MKTLKPEHLHAYAAYGLQCQYIGQLGDQLDVVKIGELTGLRIFKNHWLCQIGDNKVKTFYNGEGFKPLLIPLEKLTDGIISETGWAYAENIILYVRSGKIDIATWRWLVKNHYDVFGLLADGLAHDKTTIKL